MHQQSATVTAATLAPEPAASSGASRLVSLDAFRGLTVALMVLVNNPGTWNHVYPPLKHAEWHGCTPTDLVFPFFLFIVGVAIPFAQRSRRKRLAPDQTRRALVPAILRRTAILFGLGLLLAAIPTRLGDDANGIFDPAHLRVMGVLQRIALCYLPAALLGLYFGWRVHLLAAVALMTLYSVLMLTVPVPGHGAGDLSPEGNLVSYVDGKVLGTHCYRHPPRNPIYEEPEGLLSTLPAIATTLLGLLAGQWLARPARGNVAGVFGLLACGAVGVVLGLVLDRVLMPINKSLWTPPFALYTAGWAAVALGACYWLIDVVGFRRPAFPAVVFGMNAIAMFVLSGLIARLIVLVTFELGGKSVVLKTAVYDHVYMPLGLSPVNTSLLYAVTWVLGLFLIAWAMYRMKWFLKV